MAHFALLDQEKNVMKVIVINNAVITDDNGVEQEALGVEFCRKLYNLHNSDFKQTSYNTRAGVYYTPGNDSVTPPSVDPDQSKAFRKNFAAVGMKYDEARDAFVARQPLNFPSHVFNEFGGYWEPPVAFPNVVEIDNKILDIFWDESNIRWQARFISDDKSNEQAFSHYWNPDNSSWVQI